MPKLQDKAPSGGPPEAPAPAAKKAAPVKKAAAKKAAEPKPPPADVAVEDVGMSLADQRDALNYLITGDGGTGKTTNLATMANLGPVIFINAEGGLKARPLKRFGVNIDNIRVVPDPRIGQELTFELLEDLFWQTKAQLENDPDRWAGVCWDSLTEIVQKLLRNVVDYQVEKAELKSQERDPFFIDRADYGVMTEQVRLLVRRYRDLPCHFGMSTLLRREVDDDGKVVYRPAVTPALQNDIFGYMDIVGVTEVVEIGGDDEYRALFRPEGKFRGKDRFGAVPRKLITPTFERVLAYVTDEIDIDSDPIMQEALAKRKSLKIEEAKEVTPEDESGGTD